jgi:hypothetical protein
MGFDLSREEVDEHAHQRSSHPGRDDMIYRWHSYRNMPFWKKLLLHFKAIGLEISL